MQPHFIVLSPEGLYCPAGDFYIDPVKPVAKAIVTHAHADHARRNCDAYLTAKPGARLLQLRLGEYANIQALPYGEKIKIKDVEVSLHPAGHILGSAQIRLNYKGKTWVISGDYKLDEDPTCAPFETVKCDTFVTEATFGSSAYQWVPPEIIFNEVNTWWQENQTQAKTSILFGYALGKAQRLLAGLDQKLGPIYTHTDVEKLTELYRLEGIKLPKTIPISSIKNPKQYENGIIIAPPSALQKAWHKRFSNVATAFASGWMQIAGMRRFEHYDKGFTLSDHADWPSLLKAIAETEAEDIYVMHTNSKTLVKHLQKQGVNAQMINVLSTDNKQLNLLDDL